MPRSAATAARSIMRENMVRSAAHRARTRKRTAIVHCSGNGAERAHLPTRQRMRGWRSAFDAAHVECRGLEVYLLPAQIADFGGLNAKGARQLVCLPPKRLI